MMNISMEFIENDNKFGMEFEGAQTINGGSVTAEGIKNALGYVPVNPENVPTKTSQLTNDSGFIKDIPSEYVTETELTAKGYLTQHQDISGKADKAITLAGYGITDGATKEEVNNLSKEIVDLKQNTPSSESVLTIAQVEALDRMFKKCAFTGDVTAEYTAFKLAFGIESGSEEPVIPTLSSISATYTGGNVAVGTSVNSLTGIAVTGHYSDGTTANITGYTLSGTIVEGENTITVSYDGKTTTFTVVGIAESSGENNGWESGVPYTIEWTDGYVLDTTTGAEVENAGFSVSNFLPCRGANRVYSSGVHTTYRVWFYDENKNFLRLSDTSMVADADDACIPRDAYYMRNYKRNTVAAVEIIPYSDELLDETTVWEADKFYRLEYKNGISLNANTGGEVAHEMNSTSNFTLCLGATKLYTGITERHFAYFYDGDKNFISYGTFSTDTKELDIPANATYFRMVWGDLYGNDWIKLG